MSSLKDFAMDFGEAEQRTRDSKSAKSIEVCNCPTGYTGISCQVNSLLNLTFVMIIFLKQ